MKKLLISIVFSLCFILALSVQVCAAEETEKNDTAATATPVPVNTAVVGSLEFNGDIDWYTFTVPQDGYITVSFRHELIDNGNTYWQIRLFDSTGVKYIDDNNAYFPVSGNSDCTTNTFGVSAGTYCLQITKYYYLDTEYCFEIQYTPATDWETESNNSKATADVISLNQTNHGALTTDGDQDWYKFEITEDGYFKVNFSHELIDNGNVYWQLRLFDSTGVNYIDGNNRYFGVKGNDDCTTSTFGVSAGTYYLQVLKYYYTGINYDFEVEFVPATDWESENNNTKASADQITVNRPYHGSLSTDGDLDWYKFEVTEDGYFRVDFEHEFIDSGNNYWIIYLYDSTGVNSIDGSGHYYAVKGNDNCTTNTFGISAGTYYMLVNKNYYAGMDYSFEIQFEASTEWETENNNAKADADSIKLNQVYHGSLSLDRDVDWYKFEVTEDGYFKVNFEHEFLDSGNSYWVISIFDSTGVNYVDGNARNFQVKGNSNCTTSSFGVSAGTYYVLINQNYYAGMDYSMEVQFVASSDWETETNNTKDKADEISVNSSIHGSISTEGEADWFKFVVPAECEVALALTHEAFDSSNPYWVVTWYDSTGVNSLYTWNVRGNTAESISEHKTVPGGTYYVKINNYYHTGTDYTLTVQERHDCVGVPVTVQAATCTEDGIEETRCGICGKLMDTHVAPATGHSCHNWIVDKKATCSADGLRHATCSVCRATVSEKIPSLPHTLDEWTVIKDPTCQATGTRLRNCAKCNYTERDTLDTIDHIYGEWTVAEEATCYHAGTEERACTMCGTKESRTVAQLSHEYGEWVIVSGSKLIPPIVREKACIHCGETETMTDWSYVWVTIVAGVALIGILIGIINYIRAFKKR